ncbi:MAG: MBL fold metallo-hydrolase [Firmicutes bacterium]|nr:MBL fold metallo-hydrolase [Bacillota bacterium]
MKLTEKLYWYPWQGRANNCNSCIYRGSKTILFDPGHIYNELNESCLEILNRNMIDDGITLADIDLVLCTHGHPDHVESAGLVREKSGAPFGIHKDDQFILEAISQHYASNSAKELASLKPDFYLEEGDLVYNSDKSLSSEVKVITSPGHSPGCVCFYLPEEKTLVSGDTIFQNSIGRADLPGGDINTLGASVEKLSNIEGIELLLPGHMGYVKGEAAVKHNFDQIKRYFFA